MANDWYQERAEQLVVDMAYESSDRDKLDLAAQALREAAERGRQEILLDVVDKWVDNNVKQWQEQR